MRAFSLWRLRQERKRSTKKYSKQIDQAKDGNEAQMLMVEAADVREDIRDSILHLNSLRLLDKAEDLAIPVPSYQHQRESWEDGREPGTVHLTREAQIELTRAIRIEQKERWAVAAFVLKEIVTPIIGVLGAVMGVLSLIHAFRSK
jgi:hypothetical protein